MSSSAASAEDEENSQTEEETLSVDPEDSTKSQDTLLGMKIYKHGSRQYINDKLGKIANFFKQHSSWPSSFKHK